MKMIKIHLMTFGFLLLVFFAVVSVSAATITVTSPNGGETWQRGTYHTVTWDYSGNPGSTVKIVLLKSGIEVGTIQGMWSIGSGGHGSYTWPISLFGTTGSDYKVQVQSISQPTIKDTSNNYFTLTKSVSPPVASFTGTPLTGGAPFKVSFIDKSTGSPTGWAWYFGDETYMAPWMQQTSHAGWTGRGVFSSVVMPDGSIILMGGNTGTTSNDVWRSRDEGVTWTLVTPSAGWSPRWGQSSVVMPDGSIVLMGGWPGVYTNDVWRSTDNGTTWTKQTAHAGWSARGFQSSVAMPDGSIVLMGGQDPVGPLNDTWRSTDNGATWTQQTAHAGWAPRNHHSSVVMPDGSIVLVGGFVEGATNGNDVWRSTDNGATWKQQTAHAGWSPRGGHSSVVIPDGSIVLLGGWDQSANPNLNDAWRSTDNGVTWTQVTLSASWTTRREHSSVVMPDGSIVLMGGRDSNQNWINSVWRLMPTGSSVQNPSHTYTKPGIYNVALQAYNSHGYSSTQKIGYITVTSPSSPTITVTSPNGGESWKRGSIHPITWKYAGNPGPYVKVELLQAGIPVGTATYSTSIGTSGIGSYPWAISSS